LLECRRHGPDLAHRARDRSRDLGQRRQPGRVDAVVVRDEYPHGLPCRWPACAICGPVPDFHVLICPARALRARRRESRGESGFTPPAMDSRIGKIRAVMQIYLPIAEVSVNALTLIGLGGIVGLMSGLFGV